jgi:hypothetical protein
MDHINACFVSYRHTDDADAHAFVKAFVRQLRKQLMWWLPHAPVYFDEEGLKIGDRFSDELAFQLCSSACMVMFFSPLHFDVRYPYCALEYHAMLDLERRRLRLGAADLRNRGLIFPVIFRGVECLPAEISDSRQFENFDYVIVESDFELRESQQRLKGLAHGIFQRYQALNNAGVFDSAECNQFRFPERAAIQGWLNSVSPIRMFSMPGR